MSKGDDAYISPKEGDDIYQQWYTQAVPFRRRNRPQEHYSEKEWLTAKVRYAGGGRLAVPANPLLAPPTISPASPREFPPLVELAACLPKAMRCCGGCQVGR